jgi:hypothetical protein
VFVVMMAAAGGLWSGLSTAGLAGVAAAGRMVANFVEIVAQHQTDFHRQWHRHSKVSQRSANVWHN